ncbi:MAG: sugar ABC transporter ATP-binding protein [Planctomycetes bacterium]|nr:sugar ABC transporter ATP-binding protein [Planctomycetota bacterium]
MTAIIPLFEARGIRKRFPGVIALDGVSAFVNRGEVLAVVGENGAGKSTLMKIMAGVYTLDEGTMLLDGRDISFRNVADALQAGICLIHQELNLAENLDVAANIFLGRERLWGGVFGWLDRRAMAREAASFLSRVGLSPDLVDVQVGQLAPGQKQLVEIARALSLDARLIIMDEPTSSLTSGETERLFEVIDDLRRSGVGIVYISHRLAEVKRVADRVTVLRDGRNAGELERAEVNHDSLVRLMVGRDLKQLQHRTRRLEAPKPLLEIRDLRYRGGPAQGISLTVGAGEIVGMAGLVGAGRTELAEAVFGIRPIVSGEILLNGKTLSIANPGQAVAAGLLLVPEDRRLHGLVLEESVGFNLSLPNLDRLSTRRIVSRSRERTMGLALIERLRIKTPGLGKEVGLLSGGNQQKVVFGKWLARSPSVLILDEPTRGVDVGARGEIYAIIDQLAAAGVGIWMISSDMEEFLGMSDRIVVLHEGKVAGELNHGEFSEEAVMRLATGVS